MIGTLFNPTTLNIFCDASITHRGEETIGCSGSIAVRMTDRLVVDRSVQVLRNSTNNESEITAILLAVYQACKYKSMYETINIFSDSKISVFGLREWMSSWIERTEGDVLYSSSGTAVANQQIFIHIILAIVNNDLNINLYHQKGHVNKSNTTEAKQVFLRSNGIMLDDDEIQFISTCNNCIDQDTRETLSLNIPPILNLQTPIRYMIDQETYSKFMSLINRK